MSRGLGDVSKRQAVDATLDPIGAALANNEKVALLGFGTFAINEKPERTGINPRTKETITIAARKSVKFKQGSELGDKIK
ncbi:MAG: HU family DNA-binding protein [Muribaculaceae bacterium]|nr:HU family DNA-binding protein [Muribaculaceae bacterium]